MKKDRPSQTANKVALSVISLMPYKDWAEKLPKGLVKATEDLLVASGASSARIVEMSRKLWMTKIYLAFDWSMPGQFESFGYRKIFFEQQVRLALEHGARQVLVMGAGYDTLCWRLADQYPDVRFVEIDHPATSANKQKGLQELGVKTNMTLLAKDLSVHALDNVLGGFEGWSMDDKSVITAEGLLMYLHPKDVRLTFERAARCVGGDSRFVFTYARMGANGQPDMGPYTRLNQFLLKILGEPWLWSVEKDGLDNFLSGTNWREQKTDNQILVIGMEDYAVALRG
jgi:methyltransferase (TIGR00027 family)